MILIYYVILHLAFILLLIYNLFKDSSGKVQLERSRLWQLDNSWKKPCKREAYGGGGNIIQGLFSSNLIFLVVILMSRIDAIRSC